MTFMSEAVRYIDRNALKLYPDEEAKEQLWQRAYGSWKLQLATGGGRFTTDSNLYQFLHLQGWTKRILEMG